MENDRRADPPNLRIAGEIRRRIESGELRPGDQVPSTRRIVAEWGVAMATATKALAVLRDEGLVHAVAGLGTVVTARRDRAVVSTRGVDGRTARAREMRDRIVEAAIRVADTEGVPAVSMRRVAAELEVGAMALYRYVTGKDELCMLMADAVFGEDGDLPEPGPAHWRARFEWVARRHWRTLRRHPWVAPLTASVAAPPLVPNGMAHADWVLRGLERTGLDHLSRARATGTLMGFVGGMALNLAVEQDAIRGAGRSWRVSPQAVADLAASGRYPSLFGLDVPDAAIRDVDATFEFGLQRHLDGLAMLIDTCSR